MKSQKDKKGDALSFQVNNDQELRELVSALKDNTDAHNKLTTLLTSVCKSGEEKN